MINVSKTQTSDYILETSREYSIYVCQNRAIPHIGDGFKDVQRKISWLMRNKNDKIKTVSLSGQCIAENLYNHGDASATAAIGFMAAPYLNNIPLLEGIGSFGSRVAPVDGIGAGRYTYVKRGKALQKLILPDVDIIPLMENYDGSNYSPAHFLPLIPTVLLNGVSGIAVGWSTEILRRDFKDIVQACIDVMEGKEIKRLVPHYDRYEVGVRHLEGNTWEFTGKATVVDASTIRVTELPPDMSLTKFKEKLNDMEDNDTILSYIDRSSKNIDITIKMPRGSIKNWTDKGAIDFLKLKQKKTERVVVVDFNGTAIKQYDTAEDVVRAFVEWRLGWYEVRYKRLLKEDTYRLNYNLAIKRCFDKKLPAKLSNLKNKTEVVESISTMCKGIDIDNEQVNTIAVLPSYRWAQDNYEEVCRKIDELTAKIEEHNLILSSEEVRREIYISELYELKKEKF